MNNKNAVCCHSDGKTGLITLSQGDHSFIMTEDRKIVWATKGIEDSGISRAFFMHGGKEFLQRLVEEGNDGKSTVVTVDLNK